MDPEEIVRNIPASVVSDIEWLDKAIERFTERASSDKDLDWTDVISTLYDARAAIIYLAEKHDKLVVRLQEHEQ